MWVWGITLNSLGFQGRLLYLLSCLVSPGPNLNVVKKKEEARVGISGKNKSGRQTDSMCKDPEVGLTETQSHIAQANLKLTKEDLELLISLPVPPKSWDCKCVPPCLAMTGSED